MEAATMMRESITLDFDLLKSIVSDIGDSLPIEVIISIIAQFIKPAISCVPRGVLEGLEARPYCVQEVACKKGVTNIHPVLVYLPIVISLIKRKTNYVIFHDLGYIDRIGSYRTYPTPASISRFQALHFTFIVGQTLQAPEFQFQVLQALHSQVPCLACPALCAILPFFLPALPCPTLHYALPCSTLPLHCLLYPTFAGRILPALLPCLPTCTILPDP